MYICQSYFTLPPVTWQEFIVQSSKTGANFGLFLADRT